MLQMISIIYDVDNRNFRQKYLRVIPLTPFVLQMWLHYAETVYFHSNMGWTHLKGSPSCTDGEWQKLLKWKSDLSIQHAWGSWLNKDLQMVKRNLLAIELGIQKAELSEVTGGAQQSWRKTSPLEWQELSQWKTVRTQSMKNHHTSKPSASHGHIV